MRTPHLCVKSWSDIDPKWLAQQEKKVGNSRNSEKELKKSSFFWNCHRARLSFFFFSPGMKGATPICLPGLRQGRHWFPSAETSAWAPPTGFVEKLRLAFRKDKGPRYSSQVTWKLLLKAAHSSILAWRIPWREEPGRLQSMGWQRVGHEWATSLIHTYTIKFFFLLLLICLSSI